MRWFSMRHLFRAIRCSLFQEYSSWVVCGLAVVLFLATSKARQQPSLTSQLVQPSETKGHRINDFGIAGTVSSQSTPLAKESGHEGLEVAGWFVLPESVVESVGDTLVESQSQEENI